MTASKPQLKASKQWVRASKLHHRELIQNGTCLLLEAVDKLRIEQMPLTKKRMLVGCEGHHNQPSIPKNSHGNYIAKCLSKALLTTID